MERIRLLIVDDHRMFRQGLVSLLQGEPEFEVVGETASGQEALRLAAERRPDVALVDLRMPDVPGIEVIAELLARRPGPSIVALTASEDIADMIGAIQAGADGYVMKGADADVLLDVIRRVHAGGAALCDKSTPKLLEFLRGLAVHPVPSGLLTPREQEVLALMENGADNAEIASRLVISENTVKTHVSHILDKLGMRTRGDLIAGGLRRQRPD
jgi:two-component system, NarL family, nitrate/nitrite response regulator NarL